MSNKNNHKTIEVEADKDYIVIFAENLYSPIHTTLNTLVVPKNAEVLTVEQFLEKRKQK